MLTSKQPLVCLASLCTNAPFSSTLHQTVLCESHLWENSGAFSLPLVHLRLKALRKILFVNLYSPDQACSAPFEEIGTFTRRHLDFLILIFLHDCNELSGRYYTRWQHGNACMHVLPWYCPQIHDTQLLATSTWIQPLLQRVPTLTYLSCSKEPLLSRLEQ